MIALPEHANTMTTEQAVDEIMEILKAYKVILTYEINRKKRLPQLLNAIPEPDRWDVAAFLYRSTDTLGGFQLFPEDALAEAVGMEPHEFRKSVYPVNVTEPCATKGCENNVTFAVKSRGDKLAWAIPGFRLNTSHLCARCQKAADEQAEAERVEEAKRLESAKRKRNQYMQDQREYIDHLRTMPYSDYLQTDHWKRVRGRALRRAGYKCQLCNSDLMLAVHHRTYKNRGDEHDSDLIVLCRRCHADFHRKEQ